ncbi:hypothetical protein ANN_24580 [Periplaneta americana]|uniref:Uncharacterized protein n=1 Tax=Periplaneta americana TaxID=6978 RepID=A0ABQ8S3S3_PERAM|nr:hypothetical protein ANN_24580 [Periplaneta americana]
MKSEEPSSSSSSSSSSFSCAGLNDTCNMMLSANIPLKKLSDPILEFFFRNSLDTKTVQAIGEDDLASTTYENISSFTATLVIASMMTRTELARCRATGIAQSTKALACRFRVALGRGFDSRFGFSRDFPQPFLDSRLDDKSFSTE